MARGRGGKSEAPHPSTPLRWAAWAVAVLALGSAFTRLSPDAVRVLHWAMFVFALVEIGIAVAQKRRWPLLLYLAIAVLVNPFRPFVFAPQTWRLIHAVAGAWFAADHLP